MKPITNDTPSYNVVYPIGSTVAWYHDNNIDKRTVTIKGYSKCPNRGTVCMDCDGILYQIEEDLIYRCHYRRTESSHGLCFWTQVPQRG